MYYLDNFKQNLYLDFKHVLFFFEFCFIYDNKSVFFQTIAI